LADQNIVTNITATANFSSLTAQLQAVTSQLLKLQATTIGLNKNLTSQVGVMNRQFDETMRSTGQFARHFVTLTSDVSKFGQNLDSGRMKLSQYFQTWQGHTRKTSSLVKELAKQQVMLENAVVQPLGKNAQGLMQYNVMVQSGLDVTKNKSALLRQELAIMNKVMMDGSNQLINWGKNTQWAGRQLTVGLTVPLAAFGMAAAKAFREADQELVRLTKVYGGLTATSSADLLQVRKDVIAVSRELASGLGANFKETIGVAADIAATGKQGAELIDSTRQTTRLAILGEVDRQDAMKATLAIQTAFSQNTMELAESIDFLNAVENQTSTTLEDLVTAIPKAGPVVKALGGDVQDLALYLTAMREGGINASEGANALKSALASVINPTKVAKEMFMGLGIDLAGIVDKNAGNLTGTIMALKDSLDSLEPLQRARAIEQLFGKFQFARINALFENLGKQGSQTLQVLDLMKASTQDLASISERELNALTESASGKYRRALESVKAELAIVGEQFLKVGAFVLNAIDGILKFIGNLPGPIKAVLGFIGSLTAIAGPIIMLTGVLANFFGYIIKGVLALKNIGKGGTGFKLLTPELMAAASAAETVEQSFYSDTKAAATFSDAVLTLAASFEKLKQSAMSSTIATSNSMSTVAGNPVMGVGGRIVDKSHPLVGRAYSRDMSHLTPTGSLTPEQRARETIFSTVPGPKPVNQRISNSPQVYMDGDLPKIPGITSVNGVSTGVVAAEAAKWHSMTAAIAMQSKAELAVLKTEIAATGTITASLADSYQALLPQMTKVTTLAAQETAMIVQQLQAGKITVEAARAKIFALNAQVEAMIAQTATGVATAQARTLSLTTVPLTTQPVVNAAGRSNMKELFHKSETSKMVDVIARALGVRTSGAGYSIETTKPRFNTGGQIESFGANKTRVSGPASISYDDRMGSVPLNGYVLNQPASLDPRNAPLVQAAASTHQNSGGNITALLTPQETVFGPGIQENPELFAAVDAANNGIPFSSFMGGGNITLSRSNYGAINPAVMARILGQLFRRNPKLSKEILKGRDLRLTGAEARAYQEGVFGSALKSSSRALGREYYFVGNWGGRLRSSVNSALAHGAARRSDIVSDLMHSTSQQALPSLTRFLQVNKVSPDKIQLITDRARANIVSSLSGTGKIGEAEWSRIQHREYLAAAKELRLRKEYLESLNVPGQRRGHSTDPAARGIQAETALNPYGTTDLGKLISANDQNGTRFMGSYRTYGIERINGEPTALAHMMPKFNSGGRIGGMIRSGKYNYGVMGNVLKSLAMRRIGAGFGPTGAPKPSTYESAPWGVSSLSIKAADTLFADTGLRKNSQKLLYDKFAAALAQEKPYGYVKGVNGELRNALEPASLDSVIRKAASDLMSDRRAYMQLSPIDRDILRKKYLNWESKKDTPITESLKQRIFGSSTPGFMGGGIIRRGKNAYGVKGNPAARAAQEAAKRARREAFEQRTGSDPEYREGPLTGSKTTVVGNGGVRTNVYGLQGSLPYAPGLGLPFQRANIAIDSMFSSIGNSLKTASDRLIVKARMLPDQIKSSMMAVTGSIQQLGTSIKTVATGASAAIASSVRSFASSYKPGGSEILKYGAPGAFIGTREDRGARITGSFKANAAYSTAAMMHPIQYLKTKGIGADPNTPLGSGNMGNMVGMMGGMAAGTAIGGKLGGQNGAMMGSMVGMMAGQSVIKGVGGMIAKRAAASAATAGLASAGFGATAAAAAGLVAPLAAVTAAGYAGYKMWKHYKEGQTLNISTFGMTAEAAKKANLRFTDFGSKIKDTIQDSKDMAAANKLVYESMKDGGTPFQMSIAEYKKLKKEVKETFGEQIKALDRQPSNKVPDAVRRIKEQLIAAGMSADEATKKVFTMLQLSNKKDQSITATMGNNSFKNITDPQSAAVSAVTSFGADTKDQGNKEKAASLNTALMATETGINDLIAKRERLVAKDLSGKTKSLTYAEAEKIMIDKINKSKEAGTVITQGTIDEMAKTNPEVRKMINGSDTVVSVWQKIRLEAQGFEGDLSQLNAAQTKLIADSFAAISDAVVAKNRGGILKDQYASLDKLEKQIKNYTKALKGQSVAEQISDRDRLKALNKQIEAINKLAESRKKALAAAQEDANLGRQIEKVRLEIQNAVSVGDTEKAQSLRIDLESLTSQQQTDAQMKAIDTAAEAATKPLKAAMDAITNKQEKLGDAAALAGESLDKLKDRYDKQQAAIKKVNDSMTALYGNAAAAGLTVEAYAKKNKEASAGFVAAMEAATGAAMPKYKEKTYYNGSMLVTEKVPIAPYENALELLAKSGAATGVNEALANSIKGGATLKDVVDAVNGKNGKPALRKDIVVKGDYSNSKEDKEFDGKKVKVLNAEARDAIRKRLKLEPGETFIVDGQKYKQNTTGGTPIWVGPAPQTPALHEGGKISGPGTSTSDSIPAMLSDGEYVFSAKAVDAAGGPDAVDSLHKALRRADGGPIGKQKPQKQQLPFFPWRHDLPDYWSNGAPTGNPRTGRWGELRYNPSKGKDIWGGTEIPGLKFTGKTPQQSDYWHQMTEQPSKSRGPGMGIDKDPMRLAGSGASMGFSGNGAYGFGPLLFAEGGSVKKQNWFQRYVASLTKSSDSLPAWARDPLGVQALLRNIAGQGRKGDNLSSALMPLNFMGVGKLGKTAASSVPKVVGSVSHLTPEMKSFSMADIDAKAIQALSKLDPSSIKIPETGITFSPSSARAALEGWKQTGDAAGASLWEIVQAQRETLLKAKYPKIDFSDVAKFNEYYAKEFYDLLPDEAIKLFKGVRSTAGDAWRTGQKDLGTYFSTNPHVAALYSAMIGKAKIGEELPMFSIDKRISELKNFLGEGAIRNGSAQGSMEFPQVLGGEDLSRILPNIYSLPGQVYGQMFGATAKSLKEIKNLWPSGFAQGGYVPKFKNGINVVPQDMLAMIHKNESIVPASMNPFNPDAAMPKYNFNRSSFNVRGDGAIGASYTVNQNIYASDGMDVEALSNMIVKKAEVVIGQKAKVNVKMVGQGKNI
jgi:TP901 family phage tail tape measure protein